MANVQQYSEREGALMCKTEIKHGITQVYVAGFYVGWIATSWYFSRVSAASFFCSGLTLNFHLPWKGVVEGRLGRME